MIEGKHEMKRLTLTFDNGPTLGVTDKVLNLLARNGILSTFFVIGRQLEVPKNAALLTEIAAAGHQIGNHTWSHSIALGERVDAAYAQEEIDRTQTLLGPFADPRKFFRPFGKHGRIGPHLFSQSALSYLRDNNFTTVTWTSVPGDMRNPKWDQDFEAGLVGYDWQVVVLHDIENACISRLPDFIARLKDSDFELRQDFPEAVIVTRSGAFVTLTEDMVSDGLPS